MAYKWNAVLPCVGGDGQVGVAGDVIVDFHEIPPLRFEVIHRCACLGGAFHDGQVVGVDWRRPVHNWTASNKPRPQTLAVGEFLPPPLKVVPDAARVPHAGHTIRWEEWEDQIGVPNVHVHVSQSRNEKFSPRLNDAGASCHMYVRSDFVYPVTSDQDVNISPLRWCQLSSPVATEDGEGGLGMRNRYQERYKCNGAHKVKIF